MTAIDVLKLTMTIDDLSAQLAHYEASSASHARIVEAAPKEDRTMMQKLWEHRGSRLRQDLDTAKEKMGCLLEQIG
jgi:nitric oxide reductase activation protein